MRVKMTITADNRAREVYIDNFEELSEQDIFEIAKRELGKIPRPRRLNRRERRRMKYEA